MDELGAERRIHSCMPQLPGMAKATTAWTLADGGVGRDWRWRYGAPSDEGKSVGAPPCSGEPTGGERRGRRAQARLNLGDGRRLGFGLGGGWRAREEEWRGPGGPWEGEMANGGWRGLGGGLLWRGDGAPWTSAPARSFPLLGVTGARVCVSGAFVEMVYGQRKGDKERGSVRAVRV